MSNSAFSASEAKYLAEPDYETCPQHGIPTDSWGYCSQCDEEAYDYACNDADEPDTFALLGDFD